MSETVFRVGDDGKMYVHGIEVALASERDVLRSALRLMLEAYEQHARWCGYNPDAPGDTIVNRATDAARDALYVTRS